jgi:hypothetical protein
MERNRRVNTARKIFIATTLASLIILFELGAASQFYDQTDWKQWTARDVHQILTKSPWVSNCCREPFMTFDGGAGPSDSGFTARIVSSQTVREALARRVQLDKRYEKLDPARREEVDQGIAACLNEKFDTDLVFSFSVAFWEGHWNGLGQASPDQVYLLTSDGRKIVGHLVPDSNSIEAKCGGLPNQMTRHDRGVHGNEIAFPRFDEGKSTVGPDAKTLRIAVDYNRETTPSHTVGELDFNIEKLIHHGKPDF